MNGSNKLGVLLGFYFAACSDAYNQADNGSDRKIEIFKLAFIVNL